MGKGQDNSPEIDALNDKISELREEIAELKEKNEEIKNTNYNKEFRTGYKFAEQNYKDKLAGVTFGVFLLFVTFDFPLFEMAFREWDIHPIFKIIIGILFFFLVVAVGVFLWPDKRDSTFYD